MAFSTVSFYVPDAYVWLVLFWESFSETYSDPAFELHLQIHTYISIMHINSFVPGILGRAVLDNSKFDGTPNDC